MAKTMKPIKVTSESELIPLLNEAELGSPVLLERRGVVYRLSTVDPDELPIYEPDAEEVHRILDETLGSWADLDIDEVIEYIYEARRVGSRPANRP